MLSPHGCDIEPLSHEFGRRAKARRQRLGPGNQPRAAGGKEDNEHGLEDDRVAIQRGLHGHDKSEIAPYLK